MRAHGRLGSDFKADADTIHHALPVFRSSKIIVHDLRFGFRISRNGEDFAAAAGLQHTRAEGDSVRGGATQPW